ncbi:OmpH family outer membrane protein [Capnocytophaga sp. ARDL2]|uniref:OmpH family outer membrane protein n=1 Tax=Capnocytophaga sp. ARDL2 TaxID=3238809 RepID=UPI003556305A
MKQIRNIFAAAVLFLGTQFTTSAQDKIAHVNFAELVQAMPETAAAQKTLTDLQAKYKSDYDKMVNEFQTKATKYQKEAPTAGDATNQARSKELQEAEMRIAQFEQTAAQEIQKKSIELNNPIMDKAFKAVEKVSNTGGYTYVFDSGSGLIIAKGKDLMAEVKKELGIK